MLTGELCNPASSKCKYVSSFTRYLVEIDLQVAQGTKRRKEYLSLLLENMVLPHTDIHNRPLQFAKAVQHSLHHALSRSRGHYSG